MRRSRVKLVRKQPLKRATSTPLGPRDVLGPIEIPATKAKNHMGRLLKMVMQGHVVLITMHQTPEAAVIPMAEYARLNGAAEVRLDAMTREFDQLLDRMQTPAARKAMQQAFDASPEKLASNAVAAARKRA
jgi:prevent-host-death family protein